MTAPRVFPPPPPLRGLVLAGGQSTRMRADKALLAYHGKPQLEWVAELLHPLCLSVHVSVRADQVDDASRARWPRIVDALAGVGPIAGILAAQSRHPDSAWLVVACDLPFLEEQTLAYLIAQRDPARVATAYRSAHDGLPEPLCAIWEPASRPLLEAALARGKRCPRAVLIGAGVPLAEPPRARALDNVNTPDERAAAQAQLACTGETA